ncbi:T9SS type A sorting domain-containing protein [Segetibacter sp. 3557_3]|uniref:T9SS type A sorting domain-containing protein n=1 Tax=Segetibacter sp. 3557_3 TaxID=2547429 RepID=UPI001058D2C4|nr:T9SS type A sorting domain-containing protein [Segetibacter sp. 3557_3]TDH21338.1 T9SS type A sorting domain-containing protein [Segetibacter sp. 3557_3]
MKRLWLSILTSLAVFTGIGQTMQATIKPGTTPRTIDLYVKSSASFSQRDENMTFVLAFPNTITPAPVGAVATPTAGVTSSGPTPNSLGPVAGISGIQPTFLVNNLGSTSREVVISTQTINGAPYYLMTFIFANTATVAHNWVANEEQRIFSIQFNGCTANCNPNAELLVNMPGGGGQGSAYWYFQANVLGDITNYQAPFYQNPQSTVPVNGGSSDALSYIGLANPVSLPIKLAAFDINPNGCAVNMRWEASEEINAGFYGIERSTDATNFVEIGQLTATNARTAKNYTFSDNGASAGKVYYRLRMVDKDGKYTYSQIREVALNCSGKNSVQVYPTVTTGQVTIKLPQGFENASIAVYNSVGTQVLSEISKTPFRTLNLKSFASGTYFVQIVNNGAVVTTSKVLLQ